MTPADREEVERITKDVALEHCESRGSGFLTFILLLATMVFIGWLIEDSNNRLSARISALETQVRELREARK